MTALQIQKIKIVPQQFSHHSKLGQQNSLNQDTTCSMCESNFSDTIYGKLLENKTKETKTSKQTKTL